MNLKDRDQFRIFDDWFDKMSYFHNKYNDSQSTMKSFTNGLLLFTYAITELKNQLRMECIEKANILSKL